MSWTEVTTRDGGDSIMGGGWKPGDPPPEATAEDRDMWALLASADRRAAELKKLEARRMETTQLK